MGRTKGTAPIGACRILVDARGGGAFLAFAQCARCREQQKELIRLGIEPRQAAGTRFNLEGDDSTTELSDPNRGRPG